jgi:hypothetical protein
MNYDARSRRLNTEVGLIVHSPDLAAQTAQRFQAMTQPASAYAVTLQHADDAQGSPLLIWSTCNRVSRLVITRSRRAAPGNDSRYARCRYCRWITSCEAHPLKGVLPRRMVLRRINPTLCARFADSATGAV